MPKLKKEFAERLKAKIKKKKIKPKPKTLKEKLDRAIKERFTFTA